MTELDDEPDNFKPVFEIQESFWAIIERAQKALRKAGAKEYTVRQFTNEALDVPEGANNIFHLLTVLRKYFEVK